MSHLERFFPIGLVVLVGLAVMVIVVRRDFAIIGSILAVVLGWLMFAAGKRLDVRGFFRATVLAAKT